VAGLLVLGVSGAVTALGDTLFPVSSLAEGKAQTVSDSAHLFVRLRVWHPTLAVIVGLAVAAAAVLSMKRTSDPTARRLALAVIALFALQLGVGVANVWLLAPVWMQVVHLLLTDLLWIAMVLLSASALSEAPARLDRRG
jgi:heme A synthase